MRYGYRHHRQTWRREKGFLLLLIIAGATLFFGLAVMILWNAILPPVTGVQPLTYWQAVGLLVLSRILFGGWRRRRRRFAGPSAHWREKWASMSEEERARYRQAWRERCGPKKKEGESEQGDIV